MKCVDRDQTLSSVRPALREDRASEDLYYYVVRKIMAGRTSELNSWNGHYFLNNRSFTSRAGTHIPLLRLANNAYFLIEVTAPCC